MAKITEHILKNGKKRYKCQVYLGKDPLTGKDMRTTITKDTKREVERELKRIQYEVSNGTYRKESADTFEEVYNLWIVQYQKTVEESTFEKVKTMFDKHILPALGKYKIEKITFGICQKAVNEWAEKYTSANQYKSHASMVFKFAIKHGYIEKDPMKLVEVPREKKEVIEKVENFYDKDELKHFLECAELIRNPMVYVALRLLAYSGMRKGELLALTWNDINFKENEIHINKALARGENNRLYVKTTKTGIARTITMDEHTMAILAEWRTKQKQDYLKLGYNTLQPKQLVFSNRKNTFIYPTRTGEWVKSVQDKKEFKLTKRITTHGLRHTHCSLLFEANATIKEVQDRLGHTDIQTTMNIYAHVSKNAKQETAKKFANFMES